MAAVQTGNDNTQHVTQTVEPAEQARILSKVKQILNDLEEVDGVDDIERIRAAVEAIGDEASASSPAKLKLRERVVEAMAPAGVSAGTSAAVSSAVVALSQLLPGLG